MTKEFLINETERILDSTGYEYCKYNGCFDIAARKVRRDEILLIKVLSNVDSLQEEQSINLRILSNDMDALPFVIGTCTRYEKLKDNVIYERFGIPTFTVRTLENILLKDITPVLYRFRGGLFAKINPKKLRDARIKKRFSQRELAERVGISKKAIYEHEAQKKFALFSIVKKIESVLDAEITEPVELKDLHEPISKKEPKNRFEKNVLKKMKKIGFHVNVVHQTPFNIIAKERVLILSNAERDEKVIKRNIPYLKEFSDMTKNPAILITEKEGNFDLPCIHEKELDDISLKELIRIAKGG